MDMMNGKVSLKTVIVLVILLLVGVLSVLGVGAAKTYLGSAAGGSDPKLVLATPGNDGKSVEITWNTDKAVQSVVEYGTTPASLLLRSLESDATTTHRINISPLKSATSYYFRIRVGEEVFDNSGIPYSFKTKTGGSGTATTPTVKPTLPVVLVPTVASASGGVTTCNHTTDYNGDGVVNSIDFIKCVKGGGATTAPTPTIAGGCQAGVDYDGNGTINSLDRIKCLQKKN